MDVRGCQMGWFPPTLINMKDFEEFFSVSPYPIKPNKKEVIVISAYF